MVVERDVGPVYEGSDGRFYTDWQVDRKLTDGDWRPCLQYPDEGRRLVASDDGDLLMLVRVDPATLPAWAELRADGEALQVVDTRRTTP